MTNKGPDEKELKDALPDADDAEHPTQQPSKQHLAAASVGTLCAFLGLSSLARQTTTGLQISDRLWAGAATVAMTAGLVASVGAWRRGGFSRLKEIELPPIAQAVKEFTARTFHNLGLFLQALGAFLAFIVVIFTATGELAKWAAVGSIGSYLVGRFLASILKRMPVTTTARLNALKPELQAVARQAEFARKRLEQVSLKIAELTKEVRDKNDHLNNLSMTNEEINRRLDEGPDEKRFYQAALRENERRSARQQRLNTITGILVGFALSYVANLTSANILEWLRHMINWMH